MNNLFAYLFELNIALVILFVAYKLFFERDKNFTVRRIYLLGVTVLPFILPLMPDVARMSVNNIAPVSINLEGITVFGKGGPQEASRSVSMGDVMLFGYLLILSLGLIKLFIQLLSIFRAIIKSERMKAHGITLLSNPTFHASSFFGYIFIDPESLKQESFNHILVHESIHKREWHSIDRILVELFVMINWFNPVAWMFRKSVIENLEYLADSAVVSEGTDPMKYQLSILNQYIGSASITNQFSSQIKNRINMLNKNYRIGSKWKLFLMLPLVTIAFYLVSCTENGESEVKMIEERPSFKEQDPFARGEIFYIVEEMPTFQGGDPKTEFRKHIAQNLRYPEEAYEKGVEGRVIISFVVTSVGKVVIPEPEVLHKPNHAFLDEVVVVSFRTLEEDQPDPEQKYIDMLKDEVIRVITESPEWEPGKQRGIAVNVMYTFPVNFILQ
ncbi:MAG: energy transducer TonB [Bacteroidales bacterium]|nr:energy transducer TonB [Bacteroidales bacterium]